MSDQTARNAAAGGPATVGDPAAGAPAIRVRTLHKSFGDLEVLRGIDLDVAITEDAQRPH